jgi:hypothetical protein
VKKRAVLRPDRWAAKELVQERNLWLPTCQVFETGKDKSHGAERYSGINSGISGIRTISGINIL